MKAQMRFQKYICLAMIIVGALALLYAFLYLSGSMTELSWSLEPTENGRVSTFTAREGYYNAELFNDIQGFNNALMICGIAMILLAVTLFITSCNKRRNYYISNYVATGLCAGGNIVMSIVLFVYNIIWRSRFLQLDFDAWRAPYQSYIDMYESGVDSMAQYIHYSESTLWFDIGFVVFPIVIIASVFLILNLVWKIKLMQGEKKLLAGSQLTGGEIA